MAQVIRILDHRGNPIPRRRASMPDYEGAARGRRMGIWGTSAAGPSASVFLNLATLRSRSRELIRNDPQICGALDTLVSNLVGKGISPRWQLQDSSLKKSLQQLWADWVPEADADELASFYGLQALICRSTIESGECFVRFRPRLLEVLEWMGVTSCIVD